MAVYTVPSGFLYTWTAALKAQIAVKALQDQILDFIPRTQRADDC